MEFKISERERESSMGRGLGYSYSYNFGRDDEEILNRYPFLVGIISKKGGFVFEIRTSFKLKTRVHDEIIMGSERFGSYVFYGEENDQREKYRSTYPVSFRLQDDYWISGDEFEALIDGAMDYGRQRGVAAAEQLVIPVVVELSVWTVQQEGESVNETVDRAIRPERLIPIYVWPSAAPWMMKAFNEDEDEGVELPPYLERVEYLWNLPRIRVEDEAGLNLMDYCPVCLRSPIIGDQVLFLPLPNCNHACHPHCFFKWLQEGGCKCPSCALYIPFWEQNEKQKQDNNSHIH